MEFVFSMWSETIFRPFLDIETQNQRLLLEFLGESQLELLLLKTFGFSKHKILFFFSVGRLFYHYIILSLLNEMVPRPWTICYSNGL